MIAELEEATADLVERALFADVRLGVAEVGLADGALFVEEVDDALFALEAGMGKLSR